MSRRKNTQTSSESDLTDYSRKLPCSANVYLNCTWSTPDCVGAYI